MKYKKYGVNQEIQRVQQVKHMGTTLMPPSHGRTDARSPFQKGKSNNLNQIINNAVNSVHNITNSKKQSSMSDLFGGQPHYLNSRNTVGSKTHTLNSGTTDQQSKRENGHFQSTEGARSEKKGYNDCRKNTVSSEARAPANTKLTSPQLGPAQTQDTVPFQKATKGGTSISNFSKQTRKSDAQSQSLQKKAVAQKGQKGADKLNIPRARQQKNLKAEARKDGNHYLNLGSQLSLHSQPAYLRQMARSGSQNLRYEKNSCDKSDDEQFEQINQDDLGVDENHLFCMPPAKEHESIYLNSLMKQQAIPQQIMVVNTVTLEEAPGPASGQGGAANKNIITRQSKKKEVIKPYDRKRTSSKQPNRDKRLSSLRQSRQAIKQSRESCERALDLIKRAELMHQKDLHEQVYQSIVRGGNESDSEDSNDSLIQTQRKLRMEHQKRLSQLSSQNFEAFNKYQHSQFRSPSPFEKHQLRRPIDPTKNNVTNKEDYDSVCLFDEELGDSNLQNVVHQRSSSVISTPKKRNQQQPHTTKKQNMGQKLNEAVKQIHTESVVENPSVTFPLNEYLNAHSQIEEEMIIESYSKQLHSTKKDNKSTFISDINSLENKDLKMQRELSKTTLNNTKRNGKQIEDNNDNQIQVNQAYFNQNNPRKGAVSTVDEKMRDSNDTYFLPGQSCKNQQNLIKQKQTNQSYINSNASTNQPPKAEHLANIRRISRELGETDERKRQSPPPGITDSKSQTNTLMKDSKILDSLQPYNRFSGPQANLTTPKQGDQESSTGADFKVRNLILDQNYNSNGDTMSQFGITKSNDDDPQPYKEENRSPDSFVRLSNLGGVGVAPLYQRASLLSQHSVNTQSRVSRISMKSSLVKNEDDLDKMYHTQNTDLINNINCTSAKPISTDSKNSSALFLNKYGSNSQNQDTISHGGSSTPERNCIYQNLMQCTDKKNSRNTGTKKESKIDNMSNSKQSQQSNSGSQKVVNLEMILQIQNHLQTINETHQQIDHFGKLLYANSDDTQYYTCQQFDQINEDRIQIIITSCEEYWNIIRDDNVSFQLMSCQNISSDQSIKINLKKALIYKLIMFTISGYLISCGQFDNIKQMKEMTRSCHSNFLILSQILVEKFTSETISKNIWANKLMMVLQDNNLEVEKRDSIVDKKSMKSSISIKKRTLKLKQLIVNNKKIEEIFQKVLKQCVEVRKRQQQNILEETNEVYQIYRHRVFDQIQTILLNVEKANVTFQGCVQVLGRELREDYNNTTPNKVVEDPELEQVRLQEQFSRMLQVQVDKGMQLVQTPYLGPMDKQKGKKYTLVLDLDETLLHFDEINESEGQLSIRPGADSFLKIMQQYYEIVIFTAGTEDYANWALNFMEQQYCIDHRLFRHHTIPFGGFYVKDLSRIGRDISKTIIVDNIADNYQLQKANGILIKTWISDPNDICLIELAPILIKIAQSNCDDVRDILKVFHHNDLLHSISYGIHSPTPSAQKSLKSPYQQDQHYMSQYTGTGKLFGQNGDQEPLTMNSNNERLTGLEDDGQPTYHQTSSFDTPNVFDVVPQSLNDGSVQKNNYSTNRNNPIKPIDDLTSEEDTNVNHQSESMFDSQVQAPFGGSSSFQPPRSYLEYQRNMTLQQKIDQNDTIRNLQRVFYDNQKNKHQNDYDDEYDYKHSNNKNHQMYTIVESVNEGGSTFDNNLSYGKIKQGISNKGHTTSPGKKGKVQTNSKLNLTPGGKYSSNSTNNQLPFVLSVDTVSLRQPTSGNGIYNGRFSNNQANMTPQQTRTAHRDVANIEIDLQNYQSQINIKKYLYPERKSDDSESNSPDVTQRSQTQADEEYLTLQNYGAESYKLKSQNLQSLKHNYYR